MDYQQTNWNTGDVITKEKLNHIEEGIGDGGLPKNTSGKISMADGTFEFELDDGLYKNAGDIKAPLISVGEEYSITWDGVEYNFVGEYPLQPGSHEITEGQTGEYPFYFFTDMGIFSCLTLDDSPTHTIKIEKSTTSIKPGTAMVFDGNKWIQQEGYAYVEKTHEDIVWEGDTNGRDSFDLQGLTAYKISDLVPEPSDLIGCVFTFNGQTGTLTSDMIDSSVPGFIMIGEGLMIFSETSISSGGMTITVPSTGIYSFMSCTLSFPKTVHKFDSELIESSGQNNVEFVKIFSNLPSSSQSSSPMVSSGGMFTDQKSLGELIGGKTIIGLTSVFHYDPNGGTSGTPNKYTTAAYPVDTQLRFPLWEQKDHLTDTSSGFMVYWGYLFNASTEINYYGVLDVYAICI